LSRKESGTYPEKQEYHLFPHYPFRTTPILQRVKIKRPKEKNIEKKISNVKQKEENREKTQGK